MSLRPRVLAAALACLPVYLTASWMPARAGARHLGIPGRAALVRQAPEDLGVLAVAAGPVIYVSTTGNDANSGTSLSSPKKTIQAGIIATSPTSPTNSGTVLVEPGTYSGPGNFNIDFGALAAGGGLSGTRNITVMSDAANGGTPANTILDIGGTSANQRRGFTFVRGETAAARVIGFTLENGNQDSGNGGAIGLGVGTSPTVQNCVFVNNEAALGGAIESAGGSPVIRECTFTNNKAVADGSGFNPGGAIEFFITDNNAYTPVITNCVFSGNSSPTDGAAIDISGDGNGISPKITNCTFTQNASVSTGPGTGGTIGVFSATPVITNCILYNDTVTGAGEIVLITLANTTDAVITAAYDDIQGGYPGTGNFSQDPRFASNLDLGAGSLAINAGTTGVPPGVDITVDRTLRGRDSQPDLGAYEVLAPTANSQSVAVAFNTAKAVTLSGTDPNLTTRPLTYTVTSGPAHGRLSGTSSNRTYTPDNGFQGADSFTFTVNNGTYTSPQVMVTLTVAAGVPTASAQTVTTGQNTAVGITLTGLDPDSPPLALTYTVTTNPAHGTLSGTAPNLTYTPTAGYIGADTFQFTVSNGANTSSAATVSITILMAVSAPTASAQTVTTGQNTAVGITLTGSDPNTPPRPLTYTVTANPAHGTLSGTAPNLTYTPGAGYFGADSFQFKVNNGARDSSTATVSITVVGAPTANAQSVAVPFNTAAAVTLTGSDPNSPARSLTFSITGSPTHGTLTGTAPNLTYTPTAGYHGSDSFQFTVNNGVNASSPATVTLTVAAGVPTASAQSVTTGQDTAVGVTLTGSDPDVPALPLTYLVTTGPAHGTLSGTAPSLTYTPAPGYFGPDSFQFKVNNGAHDSSAATVSITVTQAAPAVVSAVSVAWGSAGTAALTTNADGLRLLPAGRSTDLPWLGITRLTLTLSRAVALSAADVSVTGVNVASYGPVTVSGAGSSYTLTLAQPVSAADRVTLTVGSGSIATYTRRLDVLPGDVSDDGAVTSQDAALVRNMFLGVGGAVPTVFGDINGDGVVDINDYTAVRRHLGTRLP